MLLRDAQEMVYDNVVLFTVLRRKLQRRAHNSPLYRALSNPQLALRTPAAPFQYHHNHHPSFSVQSHIGTSARRKTVSLTRKQKHGKRLPTWRTFVLFWYLLNFTSAGNNPHWLSATAVYFTPRLLFALLYVASRTVVECAGFSRLFHAACDTLSFSADAYRGYSTFTFQERRMRMGMAWMISMDDSWVDSDKNSQGRIHAVLTMYNG